MMCIVKAAFENNNWVNFFLHSGHLHIQGCKMSKSLKNFITIKEALKKYTASQLRILFLFYNWKDTLDYSDNSMSTVLSFEKTCREFFFKVKDFLRPISFGSANAYRKFTDVESELHKSFVHAKNSIHRALCGTTIYIIDNFNCMTLL